MIAADGMMHERMSVMMRGAETNGDARQPRHRLDDSDELRRPEHTAELAMARRKIGDADRAALLIGENGRDDGGIAQIFRPEVDHSVEHDIRESLFLVARQ